MRYIILDAGLNQEFSGIRQKVSLAVGYEGIRPNMEGAVVDCITEEEAALNINTSLNHLLENIINTLKGAGHEVIADELLITLNKQIEEKLQ